ncbi:group II truncated hemoglobin [Psychrosphaera sp. B3R10]|nr:group II truncated hemoglobin [Psychrosphaera sp. I2R16]MBU2990668.1 group II truncated hemoglobin [Psychrosphaera sp. B3R10]
MLKKLMDKIVSKKPQQNKSHLNISHTPYDVIGNDGVKKLANTFYDIMETDLRAKELYDMHPKPLDAIREKFYEFLVGWTGGPNIFMEKYGHPRLRARHLPFLIDQNLRDQWIYCMNTALELEVTQPQVKAHLKDAFAQMATHIINQD